MKIFKKICAAIGLLLATALMMFVLTIGCTGGLILQTEQSRRQEVMRYLHTHPELNEMILEALKEDVTRDELRNIIQTVYHNERYKDTP